MKTKAFFISICLMLLGILSVSAQNTRLVIPDVTMAPGETIDLPVQLENTADVVALQFTLQLPEGVQLNPNTAWLSERKVDHQVKVRTEASDRTYTFIAISPQNQPFVGRNGVLLSVQLTTEATLKEGSEHPLQLSGVILSNKEGENLTTDFSAGKITISKQPDLEVSHVSSAATELQPGGKLSVSWQVKNVGETPTRSGWSETLSLETEGGNSKLIGVVYYNETLSPNQTVNRQTEVNLPKILGFEAKAKLRVQLTPNADTGEPEGRRGNNTALSEAEFDLRKQLRLSPVKTTVEEAAGGQVRLRLDRSGAISQAENFTLTQTADTRVQLPTQVDIPAQQSGTYFYAKIVPNQQLDAQEDVTLQISGEGYDPVSATLHLEDDTQPALTLHSEQQEVGEGQSLKLTVHANRAPAADLPLQLTSDFGTRFVFPEEVILPADKTSVEFTVEAKDDDELHAEETVTFTASAEGYVPATFYTLLTDNDIPHLDLTLSANEISEGGGPLSITGKLVRTDNLDKAVQIRIQDDAKGALYYSTTSFEMKPGVQEVVFQLGPVDNAQVEGERTYQVSAAVYIASCSCSAMGSEAGGLAVAPLTIFDNDGPALSLQTRSSILKEGGSLQLSLSRNTSSEKALTVALQSDRPADVSCPSTVTLPAGAASVEFTVTSQRDDERTEDFVATITAAADGYAKGNVWLTVSDQTLPDAQCAFLSFPDKTAFVNSVVEAKVGISNTGSAVLPAGTLVDFFTRHSDSPVTSLYLPDEVQVNDTMVFTQKISMPPTIGTFEWYAVVNRQKQIKEVVYDNNNSAVVQLSTVSPFTATLSCDKAVYTYKDSVRISGKITGENVGHRPVEVYVINNGTRQILPTLTQGDGSFETVYRPFDQQIGHFGVGACFPGEDNTEVQTSFDIYGVKRAQSGYVRCDVAVGEPYQLSLPLVNPTDQDIEQLRVYAVNDQDICTLTGKEIPSIAAGETVNAELTLTGKVAQNDNQWYPMEVVFETADQQIQYRTVIYYFTRKLRGQLEADLSRIQTTMTQGVARDIPFTLTNRGKGETGKITLSLPDWMQSVTPKEMASLASGESTTVILRLLPKEEMKLNVALYGNIAINCAQGDGLSLPFHVTPVSETQGTLLVDVCDEYTYYTEEAPHVKDARVVVKIPNTSEVVAEGTTDERGQFKAELPEGYYHLEVTAEKHEQYRNNILVDPGQVSERVVNLSYEAITVNWNVEETEVEDKYEVETTVRYETNVPAPVVVVEGPEKINGDSMAVGESVILYYTLTNQGLINAEGVGIELPEAGTEFSITALNEIEGLTIAPKQSMVVPLVFTRVATAEEARTAARQSPISIRGGGQRFTSCMAGMALRYEWLCGKDLKRNKSAFSLAFRACAYTALLGGGSGGGEGLGSPAGGGGGEYSSSSQGGEISMNRSICNDKFAGAATMAIDALTGMAGGYAGYIGTLNEALGICAEKGSTGRISGETKGSYFGNIAGNIASWGIGVGQNYAPNQKWKKAYNIMGIAWEMYQKVSSVTDAVGEYNESQKAQHIRLLESEPAAAPYGSAQLTALGEAADEYAQQLQEAIRMNHEFFGDSVWYTTRDASMAPFFEALSKMAPEDITYENLKQLQPTSISLEVYQRYIERIYHTLNNVEDENQIHFDRVEKHLEKITAMDQEAIAEGYLHASDRFQKQGHRFEQFVAEEENSVCSSIALKISQTMVLTRQAFRGTLSVYNGHDSGAMTDVQLTLNVKDEDGNLATSHEFQISPESLKGFTGNLDFNEGWTLGAKSDGTATILFIPTKYAAPTAGKVYSFGGTLSYMDPYTNVVITKVLAPVSLTVNPSPNLNLTYFMQRDVLGDDPLTEIIEPSQEAEFSLLVQNTGYGDARNVQLRTQQPEIIENEKGLLIDFELLSSQLNGGEKTLALGSEAITDFGDIPANGTAYAQWWMKSSLLGHFTEYDVKATHVTSHDNPDLSLLDQVTVHELIRSIQADVSQSLVGFLTNDMPDANDAPDMLYFSDGGTANVHTGAPAQIKQLSPTVYELTVTPAQAGWNYGHVADPTYGLATLQQVVRQSDGQSMSLRNFWQTDRTLRDTKAPLYENRIHFVDEMADGSQQTYQLTFEPMPEEILTVVAIEGLPKENTLAEVPLQQLEVKFNKAVKPETFTPEDLQLSVQGEQQDTREIAIRTDNQQDFVLDLTRFNEGKGNGLYTLTIQTAGIEDAEGFKGKAGTSVSWLMFRNGTLDIRTMADPVGSGQIVFSSASTGVTADSLDEHHQVHYGEAVNVKAVPAKGYVFKHWTVNGTLQGSEPQLQYAAIDSTTIIAHFVKAMYPVEVSTAEGGTLTGTLSGIYAHGDSLHIVAHPKKTYLFSHWLVDGTAAGTAPQLDLMVTHPMTLAPVFVRHIHEQKMVLEKGWNWISTYLTDTLSLEQMKGGVQQICAQPGDSLTGIAPLQAYKVEALTQVAKTFQGHYLEGQPVTVTLQKGWNWMGYPYHEHHRLAEVLPQAGEGDCITGQTGFATYENGTWEGSLNVLKAGAGYLYHAANDEQLHFQPKAVAVALPEYSVPALFRKYPQTMNFIGCWKEKEEDLTDSQHRIIAKNQHDEIIGESQLIGNHYYLTVYGQSSMSFVIGLQHLETGAVIWSDQLFKFENAVLGTRTQPYVFQKEDVTGIEDLQYGSTPLKVYSVEGLLLHSHADAKVIQQLPRGVYVINGQKYLVK